MLKPTSLTDEKDGKSAYKRFGEAIDAKKKRRKRF